MVFSSQLFLFFFLPLSLACYYLVPKQWRNFILLFFSVIFYAWGETHYLWIMIVSVLFNYTYGIFLYHVNAKKIALAIGIIVNLSALLFYKYASFIFELLKLKCNSIDNLGLPLGISFYTFHSISYLIDIYRKKVNPQYNLINMGLYIINFPQLVAGPIIRYHDVETQLSNRLHLLNRFRNGIKLFVYGLAKKMLIANTMATVADAIFDKSFGMYTNVYAWVGLLAYTLQIYFDFSGYSDMAVGIGKLFGFEFINNFKLPYSAKSIRVFWQTWHISLSTWFRDYVYIPLGGNKKSNTQTLINLLIVFILCGLWHGANITFLIWGLYHGLFLVVERMCTAPIFSKIPRIIKHIYVWITVMFGWIFFRCNTLTDAKQIIFKLLFITKNDYTTTDVAYFVNPYFILIMVIGFIISIGFVKNTGLKLIRNKTVNIILFRKIEMVGLILLLFFFCFRIG